MKFFQLEVVLIYKRFIMKLSPIVDGYEYIRVAASSLLILFSLSEIITVAQPTYCNLQGTTRLLQTQFQIHYTYLA